MTGAIAGAGAGATGASDSQSRVLLRVVRDPVAAVGKPLSYQIQLGNTARGADSSAATLRNVVLTMKLPYQKVLGQYSTITGSGMAPGSYSRRFTVSGPLSASTLEWKVAKIDPQDSFGFLLYTEVVPDAGGRLCGVRFTVTVGGKTAATRSLICQTVRRS